MSKEEIHKKIEEGSWIASPRWFAYLRNIISPILLLTTVYTVGGWKSDMDTRTFKDAQEKNQVVGWYKEGHPVEVENAVRFESHIESEDIHRPVTGDINMFIPRSELEAMFKAITVELKNNNKMLETIQKNTQ